MPSELDKQFMLKAIECMRHTGVVNFRTSSASLPMVCALGGLTTRRETPAVFLHGG